MTRSNDKRIATLKSDPQAAYRSACCKAALRVDTGDEGTSCYMCEACGKACDADL